MSETTTKHQGAGGLLRPDLDAAQCGQALCSHKKHGPLFLHGKCHPRSPTVARYYADGTLEVTCRTCSAFLCLLAVSREDQERLAERVTCHEEGCTSPAEDHCLKLGAHADQKKDAVFVVYHQKKISVVCAHCQRHFETFSAREPAAQA